MSEERPSVEPLERAVDGADGDGAANREGNNRSPDSAAMQWVFFGAQGLRAGWGLLLFALIFGTLEQVAAFAFQSPHYSGQRAEDPALPPTVQTAGALLGGEALGFGVVSLTTWLMGRIERRPVSRYGLGGAKRIGRFCAGFGWGLVFLSVLVGALWKAGLLVFEGQLVHGAAIVKEGAIWLLGFLLVALLEEYLLRGYAQFTLARGAASLCAMLLPAKTSKAWGFWIAAAVLSFVFGFGHRGNPGETPMGLVSAGLIGLVFCLSLWRTGSLWWALGFHTAWDWAQSFVFGVADSGFLVEGRLLQTHTAGSVLLSGGSTGPEGSVLILPVLVLVVMVMMLIPIERGGVGSKGIE